MTLENTCVSGPADSLPGEWYFSNGNRVRVMQRRRRRWRVVGECVDGAEDEEEEEVVACQVPNAAGAEGPARLPGEVQDS